MKLPNLRFFNKVITVAFGDKQVINKATFDYRVGGCFQMDKQTLRLIRNDLVDAGLLEKQQNGAILVRPPLLYSRRFEGVSFQLGGKPETER